MMKSVKTALAAVAVSTLFADAAFAAGGEAVSPFVYELMVFVMAIFVGYYVVWSVTPALHTPLMSRHQRHLVGDRRRRDAGGGRRARSAGSVLAKIFGFLALAMASVNIFGGFLVTQRMLAHVQEEGSKK